MQNRERLRPKHKKAARKASAKVEIPDIVAGYPFVVGLAFVLPAMHQSSLGALMLLGAEAEREWEAVHSTPEKRSMAAWM
jgi:hypothetical protein